VKDGELELVDKSEILSPIKKAAEAPKQEREVNMEENKEGDMVMKIDTQIKKKKNKKKIKGGEKKESEQPVKTLTG
jgi:hypothetical protein